MLGQGPREYSCSIVAVVATQQIYSYLKGLQNSKFNAKSVVFGIEMSLLCFFPMYSWLEIAHVKSKLMESRA